MARSNSPGDPFEQRQRALAEEEKRLAEETERLRRGMAEKAERTAAEARTLRIREENPALAALSEKAEDEREAPVLRHSAMRRRDRARFFLVFGALIVAILWLVHVLG
ncbi:caldesmon [Verrucomicrobium sp. GAS474]|uniref:hypothetical protein n=1 Tax=Verrucomicrobium sp. GAS474 TaxID=1882831 RepID=UPI00087A4834|nr:hypothetical protein [Verrucomicrobium sp. GAS474]SDT91186.1 caldesmon [Verrucomicrobium sp. GAS474]